ncbi:MAG: tetratricopeptide repeat protein [Ferruginibacter sp.]
MKKQILLGAIGVILVTTLFFFSPTAALKKTAPEVSSKTVAAFDIQQFITNAKAKLPPVQAIYVSKLENGISRGDVAAQQVKANFSLANFWKDSIKLFEPYAFYISEASKLDNSEKNLTFAAQLFLDNLRQEQDEAKLNWETTEAIQLFEKAIQLNPDNDDLKIGLGSCYVYGKGRSGNPQETMKGIQQLLAVVRKDSTNMKAQFVLGVGGAVSGQYDKALERLKKVVAAQPANLEAIAFLADTYAAVGEKEEAIKWYNISKRLANNTHYTQEVDNRIKLLK